LHDFDGTMDPEEEVSDIEDIGPEGVEADHNYSRPNRASRGENGERDEGDIFSTRQGAHQVDWAGLQRWLDQVDPDYKVNPNRFDPVPRVVEVLSARNPKAQLQQLREQRDALELLVDEVVQAYHNGFNKALHNYSQILRLFSQNEQRVLQIRSNLEDSRTLLASSADTLREQWQRTTTLRETVKILDMVEEISQAPARIRDLLAENKFAELVPILVAATNQLNSVELKGIGALRDVQAEIDELNKEVPEALTVLLKLQSLHSDSLDQVDGQESHRASTTDLAILVRCLDQMSALPSAIVDLYRSLRRMLRGALLKELRLCTKVDPLGSSLADRVQTWDAIEASMPGGAAIRDVSGGDAPCTLLTPVWDYALGTLRRHVLLQEVVSSVLSERGATVEIRGKAPAFTAWDEIQAELVLLLEQILDIEFASDRNDESASSVGNDDELENGLPFSFGLEISSSMLMRKDMRNGPQERTGSAALDDSNARLSYTDEAPELVNRGVYLLPEIYVPCKEFVARGEGILGQEGQASKGAVEPILSDFLVQAIHDGLFPRAQEEYLQRTRAILARSFDTNVHGQNSRISGTSTALESMKAVEKLTQDCVGFARGLPGFEEQISEILLGVLRESLGTCSMHWTRLCQPLRAFQLSSSTDMRNLLCEEIAYGIIKSRAEDPDDGTNVGAQPRLVGLIDSSIQDKVMDHELLCSQPGLVALLVTLIQSFKLLAESAERMGNAEELKAGGEVAGWTAKFKDLQAECWNIWGRSLSLLRVDAMLQCVYYIRRIGGRDYVLGSDAAAVAATEHADENIQALSRTLSTAGDIISNQLGWIERCYIFGGVPAQATNSLLDCTSQLDGIDGYGVQKMHRNCSALQHTFAPLINSPILSFSGDTVQHLRRVEQFFDLLLLPVDALLGMVEEQPHNYSAKQYSQLLRIEVPNRQVKADAHAQMEKILSRA